jgi:hypothetical protein
MGEREILSFLLVLLVLQTLFHCVLETFEDERRLLVVLRSTKCIGSPGHGSARLTMTLAIEQILRFS